MGRNRLLDKEIQEVKQTVAEIFAEDSHKQISLDLERLKSEIDMILNKVALKHDKTLFRSSALKKQLMAESYLIIFKVREYLLGETIDYRYYFQYTDDLGNLRAKVINFTEDEILNYMSLRGNKIALMNSLLKKQETNQEYQTLLDQHFQIIMNGLQPATNPTFKIVHSEIFHRYVNMNEGLRSKKNPGNYQVFTMGHVFEALDIAFSEAMEKIANHELNTIGTKNIEDLVFGKYLNYDSIPGTKGGDNAITMTQIKANSADILDYYTIIEDLKKIKSFLNAETKEEMKKQIIDLFISAEKYQTEEEIDDVINKAVDKLINKNLTTIK